MKGQLVIIDGPDGAGKSFAMKGLERWAIHNNLEVFDLRKFADENHRIPSFSELKDAGVILSSEPTHAWAGSVIKEELIRSKEKIKYSGLTIAQAFALDREILYRRVIIPCLEAGKIVFQERGVITSFVYQPLQIHIPLSELMNIPGNKLALRYAPSLIIICSVEPEYLMPRLKSREDSQIFEHLSFLRKVHSRYRSTWLQDMFSKFGTKFAFIDTTPPKTEDDTIAEARRIFEGFKGPD